MTNSFLEGILNGKHVKVMKDDTKDWKTERRVTKMQIYNKLVAIQLPDKKTLGFSPPKLPSIEYLCRCLRSLNPKDAVFDATVD